MQKMKTAKKPSSIKMAIILDMNYTNYSMQNNNFNETNYTIQMTAKVVYRYHQILSYDLMAG